MAAGTEIMEGSKQYDVAVLGAGPSGLTTAYCLGRAGARVVVLERAPHCGGLMRGVKRGDFVFDLGRKELYSRFPEVHALWTELLGADYREYPHRIGVLYGGRILEKGSRHCGRLRGLRVGQVARLGLSYLLEQLRPGSRQARTVEDFFRMRYGRVYFDLFVNGFNRKFDGIAPAAMPNTIFDREVPRFAFLRRGRAKEAAKPRGAETDLLVGAQAVWRHPAKGTQQIVDQLEEGSRRHGVEFLLDTEVLGVCVEGEGAHKLRFRQDGQEGELIARTVVSSVPVPLLTSLLEPAPEGLCKPPAEDVLFKKSTALVYLLVDGPPRFPHNWLEVTDPKVKAGRVVNYGTWNGDMIPKGKTGLCVEYFAIEGDEVMSLDKEALYRLAVQEAAENGLVDPKKITDHLVIQLPKTNASTGIGDRKQAWLQAVAEHLDTLPRFLETNRPGMDRATLAGIDAAEACLSGAPMRKRSLASSSAEL